MAIKIDIEGKTYQLSDEDIALEISVNLSPFYKKRLSDLTKERGINNKEAIEFLLDYYYLDNTYFLTTLYRQLSRRLFKGVDRSFIIQLRYIYTTIGHFLKRLRYI